MVNIVLEYEGKRVELDLDLEEDVAFFRFQVFSATDVQPEDQEIVGLGPGVLADSADLKTLGVQAGQRAILRKKAQQPAAATQRPPQRAPPADVNPVRVRLDDWQTCCTRVYFGDAALTQPMAVWDGRALCVGCVSTCRSAQAAQGEAKPRLSLMPTFCECSAIGDGGCLFAARIGKPWELLSGQLKDQTEMVIKTAAERQLSAVAGPAMQTMMQRIKSNVAGVMLYEDPNLQRKARDTIPVQLLQMRCREWMDRQRTERPRETPLAEADAMIVQLLHWFKHEFFKWTDKPPCDACGKETQAIGRAAPTPEEARHRAGVVEVYKCNSCGATTRFPRYNDPGKLLETRRGRCGEWANCFTLCCRSLGYDVRAAHDWTDHVWTEVWSEGEKRWVHLDPCENLRDAPMVYESGWKKKLTYVIACSVDEVVDVSKRYTKQWREMQKRRTDVPEEWLAGFITGLNNERWRTFPEDKKKRLVARLRDELLFFEQHVAETPVAAAVEPLKNEEQKGRITGSVEWRRARGELGNQATSTSGNTNGREDEKDGAASCTVPPAAPSPDAKPSNAAAAVQKNHTKPTPTQETSGATHDDAVKARAKAIFQTYFTQLTKGCGNSSCTNPYCRSSANCSVHETDQRKLGVLCIQLAAKFKEEKFCNVNTNATGTSS